MATVAGVPEIVGGWFGALIGALGGETGAGAGLATGGVVVEVLDLPPPPRQAVSETEISNESASARALALIVDIPQLHRASWWPDGWSGGNALGLAAATHATARCSARDA